MTDIVSRLYDRAYSSTFPDPLIEEAAAEIMRLRELASGYATAIETAGLIYRNTDSGPNLVSPHYSNEGPR